MRIKINDTWKTLPSTLREITLRQRIDFQQQHGNTLDEMAKSILAIKNDEERQLEIAQYMFEKMFRTTAFFLDCTVEALKESSYVDDVTSIYYACLAQLLKEEEELQLQNEFEWEGEKWVLDSPHLKYGDRMKFGELIDAKQSIQDLIKLGKGDWEALIPLCAIYLRKEDEEYQESFLYEGSDRLKLMETLPLDIALQVGFFLSSSLLTFMSLSQFSIPQELRALESMLESTSTTSVG